MSRYSEGDYEENFNNEGESWAANARRALKGKRGRKVLADLREALLALPEKRLIDGAMCTVNAEQRAEQMPPHDPANHRYGWRQAFLREVAETGEGVCAIGAYLWHRKVKAGMTPEEAFAALPTQESTDGAYELDATASLAKQEAGVVYSLAWDLAYRNDETFGAKTPEQRYAAFLAWIDTELATSATGAAS